MALELEKPIFFFINKKVAQINMKTFEIKLIKIN